MRDLLPPETQRLRRVEQAFLSVCRAWGYQEVRTPTIEYLHLFTAAGTLSPQMLHRVYSFLDWDGWSGERVVLRPDATIPTARLYSEHLDGDRPARLCYVQNVFRFAEGDESREDWQSGVELIGESGLQGDLELVLLGLDVLEALGLSTAEVVLSHAALVRSVLAKAGLKPEEQTASYDRLLDGDLEVISEIEERLPDLAAPLHLLFDVPDAGRGYLANIRQALLPALPELEGPLGQLEAMVGVLEGLERPYRLQTALARSFEYYSGPVFRFSVGDRDVGGGGRYDELLGLMGGRPVPATGFALEMGEVAGLLTPGPSAELAIGVVKPAAETPVALAAAFATARGLRERGLPTHISSASGAQAAWSVEVQEDGRLLVLADGVERRVEGVSQAASLLGGSS